MHFRIKKSTTNLKGIADNVCLIFMFVKIFPENCILWDTFSNWKHHKSVVTVQGCISVLNEFLGKIVSMLLLLMNFEWKIKRQMNSASIGFSVLQDGFTAIDVAVQQGHEKVVAALLHNDSRVNNSPVTFSFKFFFLQSCVSEFLFWPECLLRFF